MTLRRSVTADGREYTVSELGTRRESDTFQAVLVARLVDEGTGASVSSGIGVSTGTDATPRAASDGTVGLCGVPTTLFPDLGGSSYDLDLRVSVPGFEVLQLARAIGPQGSFPDVFVPVDLGDATLRRTPSELTGRVVRTVLGATVPVPFADVEVTSYWDTVAAFGSGVAETATDFVLLGPPLSGAVPAGSGFECVTVTLVGTSQILERDAGIGLAVIELPSLDVVLPGSVLAFDFGDLERRELAVVRSVDGPSDPSSPCAVELESPLRIRHAVGATAQVCTVAVDSATTLTSDAREGDVVVFLASHALANDPTVVRVSSAGTPDQYSSASSVRAACDGSGYFRIGPIARMSVVNVAASSGALSTQQSVTLDRAFRSTRVDLTVS